MGIAPVRRSYDVVVVGMQPAAVIAAAVLSKRGLRVLLLGHSTGASTYRLGPFSLPCRNHSLAGLGRPSVANTLAQLGLQQTLAREAHRCDPSTQLLTEGMRLAVFRHAEALQTELARELPHDARNITELLTRAAHASRVIDEVALPTRGLPTEGFRARRVLKKLDVQPAGLDFGRALDRLPELLGRWANSVVQFTADLDVSSISGIAAGRALHNVSSDNWHIDGGSARLESWLLECVRAHGGSVEPTTSVSKIRLNRHRLHEIEIRTADVIGASSVVWGSDIVELSALVDQRHAVDDLFNQVGEPRARSYRFIVNIGVATGALPRPLGDHAVWLRQGEGSKSSSSPVLLQRVHETEHGDERLSVISAQALLPRRIVESTGSPLANIRDSVVSALEDCIPFLQDNVKWVHSPHDGRPPHDTTGAFQLGSTDTAIHPMQAIQAFPSMAPAGLSAVPTRTPLSGLFICNNQVNPALGMEGAFIAARNATELVLRTQKSSAWASAKATLDA